VLTAVTSYTYDAAGRVVGVTSPSPADDAATVTTATVYDTLGRVVRNTSSAATSGGAARVTRYRYDDGGRQVRAIDALGASTAASFDDLDRQISTTTVERDRPGQPAGEFTTSFEYDAAGNRVASTAPSGSRSESTFNAADEVITATAPAQVGRNNPASTLYGHDPAGRVVDVTDPLGNMSHTIYDSAGRSVQVARSYHDLDTGSSRWIATNYGYDDVGNMTSLVTPNGHNSDGTVAYATTYAYDEANQLIAATQPTSATHAITTHYGYDLDGRRSTQTDGNGNVTTTSYNTWGQIERIVEPDPDPAQPLDVADRTWTSSYNRAGLRSVELSPGGNEVEHHYDRAGRKVTDVGHDGSGGDNVTRWFGFDDGGRLTTIGRPGGDIHLTYNDRGEVLASTVDGAADPQATFAYDEDGRLTASTTPAGTATYTFGSTGQLSTEHDPVADSDTTYGYDKAGRKVSADTSGTNAHRIYTYDDLGRLRSDKTSWTNGAIAETATSFDDNSTVIGRGSITTGPGGVTTSRSSTYTHDLAGRLLTWQNGSLPATTFEWDDATNRTRAGTTTFSYDHQNRLVRAGTTTFTWSTQGTRDTETVVGSDGTSTTFTSQFDAFGRLTSAGTNPSAPHYSYDSIDRVASRGGVAFGYAATAPNPIKIGTTDINRDSSGAISSTDANGTVSLVRQDTHGDATQRIAATGSATADTGTSPFGTTGPGPDGLGFQGDPVDPTTGQVWMHARFYDPATGTFTSRDTHSGDTSDPTSLNRYSYGNGDPVTNNDPTGHDSRPFDPFLKGGGHDPVDLRYGNYDPMDLAFDENGRYDPAACDSAHADKYAETHDDEHVSALAGLMTLGCTQVNDLVKEGLTGHVQAADVGRFCLFYAKHAKNDQYDAYYRECAVLTVRAIANFKTPEEAVKDYRTAFLKSVLVAGIIVGGMFLAQKSSGLLGQISAFAEEGAVQALFVAAAGAYLVNEAFWSIYNSVQTTIEDCTYAHDSQDRWAKATCISEATIQVVTIGAVVGSVGSKIGEFVRGSSATADLAAYEAAQATNTADDLAGAASRAASKVGPGSGPVYGTRVHSAFAEEVAALGRSDLFSEVSYLNGQVVPYGTPGSVRLDVVVGSPSAPTAIWDLKTGSAALTPARVAQIQSHLPPGFQNVPVLEVRP
jgi:RHS repeat-associated protein